MAFMECSDLIPHKFHKMSSKNPWINSHIKRLANKKSRLYNKARQSSLPSDWDTYRNFKSYIQRNVVMHMIHMFPTCLAPRVTITKDFGPTLSQKGMNNVVCQLLNATINYLQIMRSKLTY